MQKSPLITIGGVVGEEVKISYKETEKQFHCYNFFPFELRASFVCFTFFLQPKDFAPFYYTF
jgi:hypothetical protein